MVILRENVSGRLVNKECSIAVARKQRSNTQRAIVTVVIK